MKLLQNDSQTSLELINNFYNVDDPYILERLCGCIYGATINSKIDISYKKLGEMLFEHFFNEAVYNDILVRDYCSNTIDFLSNNGIAFEFDIRKCFAPYPTQDIPDISVDILNTMYPRLNDEYAEEKAGTFAIKRSLNPEYGITNFTNNFYGDFGRYTFGHHLSHFKNVDYELIYKYAFFYIINNLKYDNKLFSKYDKSLTHYSRNTSDIERIGKKYEWIAMYHTLALVMDKYKYEEVYSDAQYLLCSGAWIINCRDIDFSFIRNNQDTTNYISAHRKPYTNWNENDDNWCSIKDIPPFKLDLILEDKWISLFYSIDDKNDEIQQQKQSVWKSAKAFFVKKDEYDTILNAIKNNPNEDFFNEYQGDKTYNIMLMEYGNSRPYNDVFQNYSEIDIEIDAETSKTIETTRAVIENSEIKIIKEKETIKNRKSVGKMYPSYSLYNWESYKDATMNNNYYSIIPSRFLIEKMNLKQVEYFMWNDGKDNVVYDFSCLNNNCCGLYIEKTHLIKFLKDNNLKIIWLCFGNKIEYNDDMSGERRDKQSIVYFDSDNSLIESLIKED